MENQNELTQVEDTLQANATALQRELQWFGQVLHTRFSIYFNHGSDWTSIYEIPAPDLSRYPSPYTAYIEEVNARVAGGTEPDPSIKINQLEIRLTLLMALIPHIKPEALDLFFTKNSLYDRGYSEFGGLIGQTHSGFIPTGETVLFLLAGKDLEHRLRLRALFDDSHFFYRENVLRLAGGKADEPFLAGALTISEEYLTRFTTGNPFEPAYSTRFPAKRLYTKLEWEDLILDTYIKAEAEEIADWIRYEVTIMEDWRMDRIIKPGYRALFYGPPGTGKTLCASLLGKRTERPVYRIDLSQIVSKYIGETEKNLANIFDQAEHQRWILFFDEADALFGKRTSTKDAKDRYANQEIAYLLQRIEDFPGVVILATNLKGNIDEAFARRFQSMIYFPMPNAEHRLSLWANAFPKVEGLPLLRPAGRPQETPAPPKKSVERAAAANDREAEAATELPAVAYEDLEKVARDYEISGGGIVNVVRYCLITVLHRRQERPELANLITFADIHHGISRELRKEGKTI